MTLLPGRKVIETKWIYNFKKDEKRRVVRPKARLVAKRFTQIPGIDIVEVYSPVLRYPTARFMFAMSMTHGWKRKLLYVKNAFVNAPLSEEIYVCQPEEFVQKEEEDLVYLLRKAFYGLRQSSRESDGHFHMFMIGFGCEQSVAYPTVYFWKRGRPFIIYVVYIDNVLLFYKNDSAAAEIIGIFEKEFEILVDEQINKFLGFSVEDTGKFFKLYNPPMIRRLLEFFKM